MTRLNEFNIAAIPSPALARRLADLAAAGIGALNLGANDLEERRRRMRRSDQQVDAALMELAASVYRETQMRLLTSIAIDGRAGKLALSDIDRQLLDLARQRTEALDKAPRLDDGRAMFLSDDGTSIYAEDGKRLSDAEQAEAIAEHGEQLRNGHSWEAFTAGNERAAALESERAQILEWEERREEWRRQVESGELTQDELEELEQQYEAALPERVRAHRDEATATIGPAELDTALEPLNEPLGGTLAALPELAQPAAAATAPVVKLSPG